MDEHEHGRECSEWRAAVTQGDILQAKGRWIRVFHREDASFPGIDRQTWTEIEACPFCKKRLEARRR
jgi:hypothetical protein